LAYMHGFFESTSKLVAVACVFCSLRRRGSLPVFCRVVALMVGGAFASVHAQTAHFSVAQSVPANAATTGLDFPLWIAVDGSGNVYIAGNYNNRVLKETLSAYSLAFGSVNVGAASASQYVALTNSETTALSITSIAVTGTDASSFVFANNCPASLAAGASCSIHGHFAPAKGGALVATITITDSASTSPQTIALTGTGLVPPVTLSAASLSYGSVDVGMASGSQAVTVTDTGTSAVTITSIAVTGTDASSFVFGNTCGSSLAVGVSCSIHGHFAPAASGALTATITITDSASISPQSISLSGTGLSAGPVTLSATNLTYPATAVGTASGSQAVTMTNTGTAVLTITGVTVTGADASSFVFGNSCGTSLAAAANCTVHGHFAPVTTGVRTAAVTITDSAAGSPQTIALSGTSAPLQIQAAVLPLATIGVPFSYTFIASGGVPPYKWTFSGGGPDQGLQLAQNGTLKGTPTLSSACASGGSSPWYGADTPILFDLEVIDAANETTIQQFCMGTYFPPPVIGSITPSIVTPDGALHTVTVAGSNFTPTSEVFVGSGSQVITKFVDAGHLTFTLLPTPNGLFAINEPSSSQVAFVDSAVPTWVVQPVASPGNLNESFSIADPVPTITSVTAVLDNSSSPCGAGLYCQLVINGTGIVFDSQIQIVGLSKPLVLATFPTTNLPWNTVTTSAFKIGGPGFYDVMITNPDQAGGGIASAQRHFTLTQAEPPSMSSGPIFEPGDSVVAGGQDGDYLDTTPSFLHALSGETGYNLGLPATTSTQIAIGIGAESTNALGSVTIPACTDATSCSGVGVSFPSGQNPNVQVLDFGTYNQYQSHLPGTLGGVSGILTCATGCRGTGSGYTFTPDMITAGGTFTAPTWQTDLSAAGIDSGTCVMEGGHNDFGSIAVVEADIAAMMAMPCAKRGVLQEIPYANAPALWIGGGPDHNAVSTVNAWEAATYPNQVVDIDGMFASVVCPLAVTQADPESVIDCGHGVTPALFRAEDVSGTITANINSSTCTIPVTGLTGQGSPNFGLGMTMMVGSEKIYIRGYSGGSVTACTRGYASTTAASYSAGQTFTALDSLHLNGPGYQYIAEWDWAVIQAQQ